MITLELVSPEGTDADPSTTPATTTAEITAEATVDADGRWSTVWPTPLPSGLYRVVARLEGTEQDAVTEGVLRVQPRGTLPRKPLLTQPVDTALPLQPEPRDFLETTDRWRIPLPGQEVSRWNPYKQNPLKGDFPIHGQDRFLVLTAVSDTLLDGFQVPTPSAVSANDPGDITFFGDAEQLLVQQNIILSADYYKGSTAFKPFDWRVRASVVANGNHLEVQENAGVAPDVRRGTSRTRGFLALQELFVEKKLLDLSANYDFLSVRIGIQPFSSDFRGFIFTDTNLGVRLFGNYASNRWQYNLAYFERLEKDTNSALNTFELRHQRVAIANVYLQDLRIGFTGQASIHYLKDDATFLLDKNGFLARPDPVGTAEPHSIEAWYLGVTGFGHFGRLNVDHAFYYVTGEDSLNPIAGRDIFAGRDDVDISAFMGALELSIDKDWYRPKLALFYASGDDDPTDRDAEGFASIFDNPNFAGGGFSFWNRLGVRLAGTGVSLVNRGSLIPDLRSNKEEGQPNFVHPGLILAGVGLDIEATPELRLVATANYLRFETTEVLDLLTFQANTDEEIGWDLSLGARWRPLMNNNIVVLGGVAALIPGDGLEDIYGGTGVDFGRGADGADDTLFGAFANIVLTF
ncbi:MAG: hypothetical protein AAGC60_21920 [Acidobacteriota bacterium]